MLLTNVKENKVILATKVKPWDYQWSPELILKYLQFSL